jgi:hypothetical protein
MLRRTAEMLPWPFAGHTHGSRNPERSESVKHSHYQLLTYSCLYVDSQIDIEQGKVNPPRPVKQFLSMSIKSLVLCSLPAKSTTAQTISGIGVRNLFFIMFQAPLSIRKAYAMHETLDWRIGVLFYLFVGKN